MVFVDYHSFQLTALDYLGLLSKYIMPGNMPPMSGYMSPDREPGLAYLTLQNRLFHHPKRGTLFFRNPADTVSAPSSVFIAPKEQGLGYAGLLHGLMWRNEYCMQKQLHAVPGDTVHLVMSLLVCGLPGACTIGVRSHSVDYLPLGDGSWYLVWWLARLQCDLVGLWDYCPVAWVHDTGGAWVGDVTELLDGVLGCCGLCTARDTYYIAPPWLPKP